VGHNCKDDSGDIGEAQRCKCTVKITDIVVTLDCTITMPEWSGYGDANDDEQDEWDSFITGLREHERGHVEIAKEWRKKIEETLEEECVDKNITAYGSTPKEACKNALQKLKDTIKNKFDELTDEHEKEQDEYDNETDHGADQGATLGCDSDGGDGGGDDSGDGD